MERQTVKRQSGSTTIVWGRMAAPVAFFKTTGDVPEAQFEVKHVSEVRTDSPVQAQADSMVAAEQRDIEQRMRASLPDDHPDHADLPVPPLVPGGFDDAKIRTEFGQAQADAPPKPRKGITRPDGTWLDLTDQLEQIDEASKLEDMRIVGFVSDRIPRARVQGSYYLAGTDAEAIRLMAALRHAMKEQRRWALAKWTKQKKQAVGVIAPGPRDTLLVLELVFHANVREPNPRCMSAGQVVLSPEEEDLAVELVAAMKLPANVLDTLEDDRTVRHAALRAAAEEGLLDAWEAPVVAEPQAVTDVEAALRASVQAAQVGVA